MKELDFTNSIEDRDEIIETEGQLNFMLQLDYDIYEELFDRTSDNADFDYLFNETSTTFEATVNIDSDRDVTLLLVVQDDENGWRDYEVALTENEQETLRSEINKTVEKQGTSLEELFESMKENEEERAD